MELNIINVIVISISTIVIVVCSIGIIAAIRFQNKKNKKYTQVRNIIKEKEGKTFQYKNYMTKEEINEIDNEVDVDELMNKLYNAYIELENKIKTFDTNLDNILAGNLKDFYINKIENLKEKGFSDIIDGIELIDYAITEYSKDRLKFRINFYCNNYKMVNDEIVSGNNLEKVQKITLLTFEKNNDNWLISTQEKVYEKKLGN